MTAINTTTLSSTSDLKVLKLFIFVNNSTCSFFNALANMFSPFQEKLYLNMTMTILWSMTSTN